MRVIGALLLCVCLQAIAGPEEETKQVNGEISRLLAAGDRTVAARRAEYMKIEEEISRRDRSTKYRSELEREVDRYIEFSKAFYLSKAWREYYDYRLSMYRKVASGEITEVQGGQIVAPQLHTLIKLEGLPFLHSQHEALMGQRRVRDGDGQGKQEQAKQDQGKQDQAKRDRDAQAARIASEQYAERVRNEQATKEQADRDSLHAEYRRLQEQISAQAVLERLERQRNTQMMDVAARIQSGTQPTPPKAPYACTSRPGPGGIVVQCQ
ncbi:MAG: hypothetical protein ABI831_23630 [Betaproteobacteria bacterium]